MTDAPSWIAYDYDKREENLPPRDALVWIFDEFYHGVTIGQWHGRWQTSWGSDDISVSHWMPLVRPPSPVVDVPEPPTESEKATDD